MRRFRFKYRVSVLNENTLEEAWHVRLSRMTLFVYSCLLLLLTFVIMAAVIVYTPLRAYLPGVGDSQMELAIERQAHQLDSINGVIERNDDYLNALRAVVTGQLPADTSSVQSDIDLAKVNTNVLAPLQHETSFRQEYEQEERFAIDASEEIDIEKMIFFRPAEGVVEYGVDDFQNPVLNVMTVEGAPVMSVLDGVVVSVNHTHNSAWTIVIAHKDNYVSVYSGLNKPFISIGAKVKAGEAVATVGGSAKLLFYMWHNLEQLDLSSGYF
ncbi:MAG: M23 family metallopeptidase [Paludibacteraceae bacterium]|nr:M23 family metallopeptidase [Paludibacteraceae bacterium]